MGRVLIIFLHVLSVHVWTTLSIGGCLSIPREDLQDDNPPLNIDKWKPCRTVPERWACDDPSITFPTVECLMADMRTCGNIGTGPTVFYSFGVDTVDARTGFRDTLDPPGIMFNDVLDDTYVSMLQQHHDDWNLGVPKRHEVYVARYAEAIATLSRGEVFLVLSKRSTDLGGVGTNGAGVGVFPKPERFPNIWLDIELPTLQRNSLVTKITSIERDNNFRRTTDWTAGQVPDDDHPLLPASGASTMQIPDCVVAEHNKRDDTASACSTPLDTCPVFLPVTPIGPASTTVPYSASSITLFDTISASVTPIPSCVLHGQDPDQGITQAYCLCDGSITALPLDVPATGHQSDSCAYTGSVPSSAFESVTTVANTYTSNWQVCTQVAFNGPSCTIQPDCTPTQALLHVQAGTSPVNVGTLTGTALYTAVSNALTALCPIPTATSPPTQCNQRQKGDIKDIVWIDDESKATDGVLEAQIGASGYTTEGQLQSMIKLVALTAQEASGACYNTSFQTFGKRDSVAGRLYTNQLFPREHPIPAVEEQLLCSTGHFAAAQYWAADRCEGATPDPAAFLDVEFHFEHPAENNFLCDFLDGLIAVMNVAAPEIAIELDVALPEINAWCNDEFNPSVVQQ